MYKIYRGITCAQGIGRAKRVYVITSFPLVLLASHSCIYSTPVLIKFNMCVSVVFRTCEITIYPENFN